MTRRRVSTVIIDEDSSDEGLISQDNSPKASGSPWNGRLRRQKSERNGLSHDDEGVPPWRSPARLFVPTRPKTVDKATARLLAGGSGDYEDPDNAETFGSDDDLSDFIVDDEGGSQGSPFADEGDSQGSSDSSSSQAGPGPPRVMLDSDSSEEFHSTHAARRKRQAIVSSSSLDKDEEDIGPSPRQSQGASRPHRRLISKAALTTPEKVVSPRRRASNRQPAKRPCVAEILHRRQSEWQQELQAAETAEVDDVLEGSTSSITDSGTSEDDGARTASTSLARTAESREARLDRASAALDVSIRSYTLREEFEIYCEYRLLTDIDSSYAGLVESDAHYRRYYGKAVGAIEWKLRQARDAAASTFWQSCAPGLVEALELLPGAESAWDSEEAGGHSRWLEEETTSHTETCEACNRARSHATKILRLHGRLIRPETIGNRRLSDAFESASPQYRRQNEHGTVCDLPARFKLIENDRYCAQYHVGRFCCARLLLFHALVHWERRLRARLRNETKRARRTVVGDYDEATVAAKVLGNDDLLRELFDTFQRLCSASERYALSGGEALGGRYGGTSSTNETVVLTEKLHPDSEAEESSVVWGDSSSEEEPDQEQECPQPGTSPRGGPGTTITASFSSESSPAGAGATSVRKRKPRYVQEKLPFLGRQGEPVSDAKIVGRGKANPRLIQGNLLSFMRRNRGQEN